MKQVKKNATGLFFPVTYKNGLYKKKCLVNTKDVRYLKHFYRLKVIP